MTAEINGDKATMKARYRLNAEGEFLIRDFDECPDLSDMDEAWNEQGYASPFRDFVVEVTAALPRDPVVEAAVEIPDEPVHEPATASAA